MTRYLGRASNEGLRIRPVAFIAWAVVVCAFLFSCCGGVP